jgi:hypothetical protein
MCSVVAVARPALAGGHRVEITCPRITEAGRAACVLIGKGNSKTLDRTSTKQGPMTMTEIENAIALLRAGGYRVREPKIFASNREEQRFGFLEALETWIVRRQRHPGMFRTCVDSWYALERGGALLSGSGEPHWLNNPDPQNRQEREAVLSMDYISVKAMERIEKREKGLIRDHAIPLAVLRQLIRELPDTSPEAIEAFLRRNYHVGIITQEENKKLNEAKLHSRMPSDWEPGDNPYERYAKVGIAMYRTEEP